MATDITTNQNKYPDKDSPALTGFSLRWSSASVFLQAPFFRHRLAVAGGVVLFLLLLMSVAASIFATHDPIAQDMSQSLQPPDSEHWLGTDRQGRDVWSRVVYGTRTALGGALLVVLLSLFLGIPLGLVAGYYGGIIDTLIMRSLDMLLAFPALLLAILIVATFGSAFRDLGVDRLFLAVIALGVVYVPALARLVRSVTLVQRKQAYVEAARAIGYGNTRILALHVLPNLVSPILVHASLDLAYAILDMAALSFLGLGVQPPTPDWGAMLSDGRAYLLLSPYTSVSAGIAIMIAVIAFNLFGDGLSAQFDPRQREI